MTATTTSFRREAEQRLRREHILLAAERVFGRKPFDEASMQEIAREAGIGMHGLYRQFPSKQELYEQIVIARLDEIHDRLLRVFPHEDPVERLRTLALAYAGYFLERPQFFPMWATRKLSRDWGIKSRFSKTLERRVADVEKQLADVIEIGVHKRVLRPFGTALLTNVAVGIFTAVIQHHLLGGKSQDVEACAAEIVELFLHGARHQ